MTSIFLANSHYHLPLVHARSHGADYPLRSQVHQRREGLVHRLLIVNLRILIVGVMHKQNVNAVHPQSLEAVL